MRYSYILLLFIVFGCKKSTERTCFKGEGDYNERIVTISEIDSFYLYKNIKYRIFQDTVNFLKIKGGTNLTTLINAEEKEGALYIENKNKCEFFRGYKSTVEVEIHSQNYSKLYVEPSDSVVFMDTIKSDNFEINIRKGGGTLVINTKASYFSIVVSSGVGNYILKGSANNATVKVQNNGSGDASNFKAKNIFIYQNSTANLLVNIDSSHANVLIDGTGNVLYIGVPETLVEDGIGTGVLLPR